MDVGQSFTSWEEMRSAQPLILEPGHYNDKHINGRKHAKRKRVGVRVAIELISYYMLARQDSNPA